MARILVASIAIVLCAGASLVANVPEDDIVRNRPVNEEERNELLDAMEGRPSPSIQADDWSNSKPLDWADLRGKVVLLDFWGVWCKPCVAAIPKLRELYAEHKAEGFVVIGVHSDDSWMLGRRYVEKEGIEYPVVFDKDDRLAKAFHSIHYPSYYLVDRQGRLRMADFSDRELKQAIEFLLDEEYEEK